MYQSENRARAVTAVSFLLTLCFLWGVWGLYTVDQTAREVGYGDSRGLVVFSFDEAGLPHLTLLGQAVSLPVAEFYAVGNLCQEHYALTPAPLRLTMQLFTLAKDQYDGYLEALRERDFRVYLLEDGF